DVDRESHRITTDLLPTARGRHGASRGTVAGSKASAGGRDERGRMAAVPSRAVRRIIPGPSHRAVRGPVHDGRLVKRRTMDVFLVERRRGLPCVAPAISERDARADHLWANRAGGHGAHTR